MQICLTDQGWPACCGLLGWIAELEDAICGMERSIDRILDRLERDEK